MSNKNADTGNGEVDNSLRAKIKREFNTFGTGFFVAITLYTIALLSLLLLKH